MAEEDSAELLARWKGGDQQAAATLFQLYAGRLVGLVRARLSEKLAPRLDPEDVVQSAYRSFFDGVRDGRYVLEHSGDLWRLLASIAVHKLHHQVEHHTAAKRAVGLERHFEVISGSFPIHMEAIAEDPSASAALIAAEEIEKAMAGLDPLGRRMFELRLEGYTLDEIAEGTQRSQRTVRRMLDKIRQNLEDQYKKSIAP